MDPRFTRWAQAAWLSDKVLAALPAIHECHIAFTAFRAAEDAMRDDEDFLSPLPIGNALAAYHRLSPEGRKAVMNGWTLPAKFGTREELRRREPDGQMVHRIMQAESDDRHLSIFGSFVGGDSNHAAVTLQILEGTSRGEVLFRLDGLRNAVLNHWEKIAGGKMILHDKATGETVTRDSFECGNKNGVQLVETLAQAKDESQNATVSAA